MTSINSPIVTDLHENLYLAYARLGGRHASTALNSDLEFTTRIEGGNWNSRTYADTLYPDWSWSVFISFYAVITTVALVLRALC